MNDTIKTDELISKIDMITRVWLESLVEIKDERTCPMLVKTNAAVNSPDRAVVDV